MKTWILKAAVQKTISLLPFKHRLNHFFQEHVSKGSHLTDELFEDKLAHCKSHVAAFEKYAKAGKGSALEVGTGWYPIVPVGLFLAGFSEVVSIDISSLNSTDSVHRTIRRFLEYRDSGKLAKFLPSTEPGRLELAASLLRDDSSPRGLLEKLNIDLIIGDASSTSFPDGAFDLINSNNTFEHIYPTVLIRMLMEFNRLLSPLGIMSHNIDMSDHFAHLDKSITSFNFLKFSDRQWRLIDNSIQPQNRLRISDFESLVVASGFELLDRKDRLGAEEHLRSVKLAAKYLSCPEKDLLVTHTQLVSRKKNAA